MGHAQLISAVGRYPRAIRSYYRDTVLTDNPSRILIQLPVSAGRASPSPKSKALWWSTAEAFTRKCRSNPALTIGSRG